MVEQPTPGTGTPHTRDIETSTRTTTTPRSPASDGPAAPSGRAHELDARPTKVRRTRQADTVVAALRADTDRFRTAQELYVDLRERGEPVGLTTVYRHLNALAEQRVVDVVTRDDGETQYRLCGPATDPDDEHHHHVVCRVCGRSVTVSGPEVEAWAQHVAAAAGYTDVTHTLEVFGLCPQHSRRRRRPTTRR